MFIGIELVPSIDTVEAKSLIVVAARKVCQRITRAIDVVSARSLTNLALVSGGVEGHVNLLERS